MAAGNTIPVERTRTDVPLEFLVSKDGAGVAGLTVVVAVRDAATPDSYLDFADDTYKSSGWTTRQAAMTDLSGGLYRRALDLSAITNLPAATRELTIEYEATGAESALGVENLKLTEFDALAAEVAAIFDHHNNRLFIDFTPTPAELVLRNRADTADLHRWPLTTRNGEKVQTQIGVQVERGVPT
jgi:hypothetical protein